MSFNPDRINIHELTIDEPEKPSELPFDPERDITREDWQGIKDELEKRKKSGEFLTMAMVIKLLNPKEDVEVGEDDIRLAKRKLERDIERIQDFSYLTTAASIKMFAPNTDLGFSETLKQQITEQVKKWKDSRNWSIFLYFAKCLKIIDPHTNINFNLNEEESLDMNEWLREQKTPGGWKDFAENAAKMKILDPKLVNLGINEEVWEGTGEQLETCKHLKDWKRFSGMALDMKILAAEEVKVTDKGLEIKMRKDKPLTSTTPPLPETKKF